jgi:hypothetical protein
MNYRNEIIYMAARRAAQEYNLPADYFLLNAAEQAAEYWFEGNFEFACGLDAQDEVNYSLAREVMVKYYSLVEQANRVGAGF